MTQVNLNGEDASLSARQRRRLQDRKEWEAFWQIRLHSAQGTIWPMVVYKVHRLFDAPITWFREKIVDPLHDKNAIPYYHRRFNRVPEIDECGVLDQACYYEANEQYRLDKLVDYYILQILSQRVERCSIFNSMALYKCADIIEDFEQAELNNFIKYGELGSEADVRSAYMKQKHRLIWERRHPEIMAERERSYQEYLEKKRSGDFDMSFWKKGLVFQDRKNFEARGNSMMDHVISKPLHETDKPLSSNWEYFKKVQEDPEFDKEQGKKSKIPFFP